MRTYLCGIFSLLVAIQWTGSSPDPLDTINIKFNMEEEPGWQPKPTRRLKWDPQRRSRDYGTKQQDPDSDPEPKRDDGAMIGIMPWAPWGPEGDVGSGPQHPEGEPEQAKDYNDVPEYGSYLVTSDGAPSGASSDKYNSKLGTYTSTDHIISKFPVFQKDKDYLFVNPSTGFWTIGQNPFADTGYFRHPSQATDTPPSTGWQYRRRDSDVWQPKAGITVKAIKVHNDDAALQPQPALLCPSEQIDLLEKQHPQIVGHQVHDWQTCGRICNDDDDCLYWTWEQINNRCTKMQGYTGTEYKAIATSGDENCTQTP